MMDMDHIRKNIDQLDSTIIALLAKRVDLASVAASLTKSEQSDRDPKRIEQVIVNVRAKAMKAGLTLRSPKGPTGP
jgi:isochorismate pyruvate lyase